MYLTVKGIYKNGKVTLLEEIEGIKEADVLVVVLKKRGRKKRLTEEIVEALEEVKLMRTGKIEERDWEEIINEI